MPETLTLADQHGQPHNNSLKDHALQELPSIDEGHELVSPTAEQQKEPCGTSPSTPHLEEPCFYFRPPSLQDDCFDVVEAPPTNHPTREVPVPPEPEPPTKQQKTEEQEASVSSQCKRAEPEFDDSETAVKGLTKRRRFRYCALKVLGKGAYGTVHLARASGCKRVAVKRVLLRNDRKINEHREVEILGMINHPAVVSLFDSFEEIGPDGNMYLYIVMEYFPQNLYQRIGGKPLGTADLRCLSFQLLRALAHLDGLRICHRDLKPENLLIAGRMLKVADFGCAKRLRSGVPLSSYICSRWWRAPELVLGSEEYYTSVDWWSCGCVIAEMMLGQPLFQGESSWQQMRAFVRILGAPTADQLRALKPGGGNKVIEKLSQLPSSRRTTDWAAILPAYASLTDALDLPARLLLYTPASRWHPAEALLGRFFVPLPNAESLPKGIFNFTEVELSSCQREEVRHGLFTLAERGAFAAEDVAVTIAPVQVMQPRKRAAPANAPVVAKSGVVEGTPEHPKRRRAF